MANKLKLTRDQLASFLKDAEQIKQFEKLFSTVDSIAPDVVNEISINAGSAQASANDALAQIQRLADIVGLLATEPAQEHDNFVVADYIDTNTLAPTPIGKPGRAYWDDGAGSLAVGLKGGNVTYIDGQQEYALCYNDSGVALTKGQVVYISGAQGNRVAIKLAQADSDQNSAHTIGFVAESIAAGAEGWVHSAGPIYKLNTFGYTPGDTVYLSPTTPGAWTTTRPSAPNHTVILGFIERVHASVGSIYVKVDNGYELDELHNVKITSVANNDLLQYDSTGPFWKNVAPSTVTVGTATNVSGGTANVTDCKVTGSGSLGYGTGSGGAVTQATSRTTGVTLDKTNGAITLVSAAGTATWQSFTVTTNKVAATDTVIVNQKSGTDLYMIHVTNVAAGSFRITFATTGGTTTEQPVFNFAIIKAVTS